MIIGQNQTGSRENGMQWAGKSVLERWSDFSLEFQLIGPSVLDGARSKVALRDEGYVWAPIWWSSDNSKR